MKEWKEYKFGKVAVFSQGIQVGIEKQIETCKEGYVRFIRIVDYTKGTDAPRYILYPGARYMVDETDIVMMRYGTPGKVARGYSGAIANNMFKITVNEVFLNKDYTFYYLSQDSVYRTLVASNSSSTMPAINFKIIEGLDISAPSISEQMRIVKVLKSLDDKIEVNRKINENLEQQAQALFKSWFVDFEPFKDQPFVESELGMIPQGWQVVSLSDACLKVTDGSHYSPKDDPFGTIPMLSVKDMLHNGFDYSSCKKINEEEYEKMKANDCVPRVNDILVAKDGSYLKEIFICTEETKQAVLSSIAIFRSNIDVIFPEILLQLFRLPKVKKDVGENYVSGSALPRIVLKDFKKFKFVVAPIDVQNDIIESLRSINVRIHINEKESRRLAELRDTLLPKLMSGELKVDEINV